MKKQKSTASFLFGENRLVFQHGPEGVFDRHDDHHLGGKGQKGNKTKADKQELAQTGLEATPVKPAEVGTDKPISYEEAVKTTVTAQIEKLKQLHEASESEADKAVAYTNKFLDRVGIGKDALQKLIPGAQTDLQLYNGIRNLQTALGVNPDGRIGEKTLTAISNYTEKKGEKDPKILAAIAQFKTVAGTSFEKAIAKAEKIRKAKQAPTQEEIQRDQFIADLGRLPEARGKEQTPEPAQQETVASLPTAATDNIIENIDKKFQNLSPEMQEMVKNLYIMSRNHPHPEERLASNYNIGGKLIETSIYLTDYGAYMISYKTQPSGSMKLMLYSKSFLEKKFGL